MDDLITYLDRASVKQLLPSVTAQLDLIEETYVAMARGRVELPPKPGIHTRPGTFIHAMPAFLADRDVAAIKWVGAYPTNPERGLPYISGLIILNDPETGLPELIMDAAEITAVRTAVASGVSIRHLGHDGWRRVAILGYGEQGRQHARIVRTLNPQAEIMVYGGPRLTAPQDGVEVATDARSAVRDADVVITAGPMPERREPVIDPDWLPGRCLVVPIDFDAYVTAQVATAADLFVVDDSSQYDHYRSSGYFPGWPDAGHSLGKALTAAATGDLRVVCSLGVGSVDAAIAATVWDHAKTQGAGVRLAR